MEPETLRELLDDLKKRKIKITVFLVSGNLYRPDAWTTHEDYVTIVEKGKTHAVAFHAISTVDY